MDVLEEQQRRIQEAMAAKPAPSEDNFEAKAMKPMGTMEEGDAVFGSGAEVNLDSQVPNRDHPFPLILSLFLLPMLQETYILLPILCRCTGGMTSIDQENQNISTVFTLDMSGTNITRPTMIMIIHLRRLCKDTSLISFIRTLLTREGLQATP